MSSWLFKLRGELTKTQELGLGLIGLLLFIAIWWIAAEVKSDLKPIYEGSENNYTAIDANVDRDSLARADSIAYANATEFEKVYPLLPPPPEVLASFKSLVQKDELVENTLLSLWRNLQGYIWAILISIPLGFLIGLLPIFNGLFKKQVDAMRYIPLTLLTGIFIIWFGLEDKMKVSFLAFGIIVYLLPVVVQRVNEVKDVYLKTVFTIGANDWQTVKSVYIPSVMAKLMDDIRVLTAISWTYIIIAELVNRTGGVGSLAYIKARQGQIEKVFAILLVIILIGFIQDRLFAFLDKNLFPHKTYKSFTSGIKEARFGIYGILITLVLAALCASLGLFPNTLAKGEGISMLTQGFLVLGISAVLFAFYGQYNISKSTTNA